MKRTIFFLALLCGPALAQEPAAPAPRTRAPDICQADARKLCTGKNLQQECLVAHWTKLSDACQDGMMLKPAPGR